jgi:hypothetical protein
MAAKKKRSESRRSAPRASRKTAPRDAIALLKADHREVEGWFAQFEKSRSGARKSELARKICLALKVHTRIEEEIFYPVFLETAGDEAMHHEAEIEHHSAKKLIAEIESSRPTDGYYDARMKVLSEMIKHHVKEEEQAGGMFAKARQSDMDLKSLGERMAARKRELMNGSSAARGPRGLVASLLSAAR